MPTTDKIHTLLTSLKTATLEGRLRWSPAKESLTYTVPLAHANVELVKEEVYAGEHPDPLVSRTRTRYVLSLRDKEGRIVELDIISAKEGVDFQLAEELYRLAKAKHVDDLLEKVIADVNSKSI